MYIGIDYSNGLANQDGLFHYGVISQHTPAQWIWEDFEPIYGHGCPSCGTEFDDDTVTRNEDGDEECPSCGYQPRHNDDSEWWGDESIGEEYQNTDPGYEIEYAESLSCFYVVKSPFYTYAMYCSPCAPGASDLDSPMPKDVGIKGYCLGIDFYDEYSKCPYDIYSVETDELVYKAEVDTHGEDEDTRNMDNGGGE